MDPLVGQGTPPASMILSRSGIAHRCSMSTTAAIVPFGIRSPRYYISASRKTWPPSSSRGACDRGTLGLLLAARSEPDEGADQRAELHRLLAEIAFVDGLDLAVLVLLHHHEVDEPDDPGVLQPPCASSSSTRASRYSSSSLPRWALLPMW